MHRNPIIDVRRFRSRLGVVAIVPLLVIGAAQGQTIQNPSFESNNFSTAPGFIADNSPITGWTADFEFGAGLNPAGGTSQFADNGAVPDGNNVAFLSVGTTLSTTISGLTPGTRYKVQFRANAMASQAPQLIISVEDQEVLSVAIYPVGETRGYAYVAFEFEAAAATQTLRLFNNSMNEDTLLFDAFTIEPSRGEWTVEAWSGDDTSGVEPSYVYTHAYSFGNAGSATINGVTFTGVAGANPSAEGKFSSSFFGNVFPNDANNVTGGSRGLANDFIYSGANVESGVPQQIRIQGLTPGTEYVATVYSVGFDSPGPTIRWATFSSGNDRLTVNQDQFGNDSGIRVSYRYTAGTDGTATINIAPLNPVNVSIHVYGFSNREAASRNTPPAVTVQPVDLTVAQGVPVSFTVASSGFPEPTFQWRFNGQNIAGATAATYSIASATAQNVGEYDVVVTNPLGSATSEVARLVVGLPLQNPSFEADTFEAWPGYSGDNNPGGNPDTPPGPNAPITGWTQDDVTGSGLNPIANGASPFADNGIIPHGRQVAFIQGVGGTGSLAQTVPGLTAGSQYYLHFYENSRSATAAPTLEVQLNGTPLIPAHAVPPVGGGSLYREVISDVFTATGTSADLLFVKTSPAGGDTTVLIDNVTIVPVPANTAPSIVQDPQDRLVSAGSSVTFTARFIGSLPATYQWLKNGTAIAGATSASLTIASAQSADEGSYSVRITNSAGEATSAAAQLTVAVPGVFGTGLNAQGGLLEAGETDPHFTITTSPDPDFPGPTAAVLNDAWPVQAGVWVVHGPDSKWIAPQADQSVGNAPGDYVYRTTFDLTGHDPARIQLVGAWAVDNAGTDIRVNGTSTGITSAGFNSLTPFTISSGFVAGINTLEFLVNNAGDAANPTGLRVDLKAISVAPPSADVELEITRTAAGFTIQWAPTSAGQRLQSAPAVTGPWTDVPNASSPFAVTASGSSMFFRIVQ
ncbi:MAG: immunoglobulin domain-containing protein [Verrucomicrobiia bacterium]